MPSAGSRRITSVALSLLLWGMVPAEAQDDGSSRRPSTLTGEWPHYAGDLAGSRYTPLDQIDRSNFSDLEVAWRFRTDNLGPRPEQKLQGTPLMVNGVLYTTAGTRRSVVALEAATGELLWMHRIDEGRRAALSPRNLSGRGLAYWTDGRGDARILYVTLGYRLVALDAATGREIETFGVNGLVDLKMGMVYGRDTPIDLETGEVGLHATPTVARDIVIVGSTFSEHMRASTHNNTKGLVRGFDVRTGELRWTFNTIPRPGELGNATWLNESWADNGNVGVWTQITVDEELGLVYLPVETPSSDLYGGHRPGENLFAESLVCVDLETGERRWHFQIVHHPLWNMDLPGAPLLMDVTVDGREIKAVAVPTKQALLFVFDRVTGAPVWPIEERPVPQGDVPGEWYSATQPFPTKPPAYARREIRVPDDLIDFTPEMRSQALENLEAYVVGTPYTPAILGSVSGPRGVVTIGNMGGGTNWPGAAFDPETGTFYTHAGNSSVIPISVVAPPAGSSDIRYVYGVDQSTKAPEAGAGESGGDTTRFVAGGRGRAGGELRVEGLPIVKPPYGMLVAIDVNQGEMLFQAPHGDTPDFVRDHPKLLGHDIPKTGQGGTGGAAVGLLVTKTLVIVGDPQVTAPPGRAPGAMLRAYDKTTGAEVGAVWMPAGQSGSPMSYVVDGRQYVVVAVSNREHPGEYIAFALPE